jgi:hypothetical protein
MSLRGRSATAHELLVLLVEHGRWWLVPLLGVLFMTALVLLVLHAAQYVAPFVYTLF